MISPFLSPPREYSPSCGTLHPLAETVAPLALAFGWLVGRGHMGENSSHTDLYHASALIATRTRSKPRHAQFIHTLYTLAQRSTNRISLPYNQERHHNLILPSVDHNELWRAALTKIEPAISRPSFLTWFQGTGIGDVRDGTAVVCVPNGFAKEWLESKYHKTILHTLRELTGDIRNVSYEIGRVETIKPAIQKPDTKARHPKHAFAMRHAYDDSSMRELAANPETNLNLRYMLDNFIVGSFNELAFAAAQAVLKKLAGSYNPFFIYGGVGLGKTHLIQAIGNEALKQHPGIKVRYTSAERYMGEVVDALRAQEMNKLKEKYRTIDLFIVDDIQFIARTEKMQEEFFHTFNALYMKDKQIIISSDRPPSAISALEQRLRSRFEGGMIADVGMPDFETRVLILRTKASEREIVLPDKVLERIADHVKTNIRELEGALNRIIMTARMSNAPMNEAMAEKLLANHAAAPKKFLSPKKIVKAVAEFYDIEERDLLHRSRKKDVVRPRQIAMYIMRSELKFSYPSIGERFGGRDHTTAIHSCEKVANDLKTNPELEEEIQAIKDKITMT